MKKCIAYAVLLACALWFLFVVFVNIDAIVGGYGDGPPYYGRTTNMDKWESPVPMLFLLDTVSIAILFILGRWASIQIRNR